jgi:hypothetical protein
MTIDPGNLQFGQSPKPTPKAKKTKTSTSTITRPGAAVDTKVTAPESFGIPSDILPTPEVPKDYTSFAPAYGGSTMTAPADFGFGAALPPTTYPEYTPPTTGNVSLGGTNPAAPIPGQNTISLERQDAFQFIKNSLMPYGLQGVGDVLTDLMQDPTIGPEKATYTIKYDTSVNPKTGKPYNDAYAQRFAGNFERIKAGKPAYSEGEYLAYETQYAQTLSSMGYDSLATRANYNKWIAGDVSPSEVAGRINIAQEIYDSTPAVKEAFNTYFPGVGTQDIVTALLDSTTGVPALKQKAKLAQIGGASKQAGFGVISESRAAELAQAGFGYGETYEGYQRIAGALDRGRQLASMQGEGGLTLAEAESAVFGLQGKKEAEEKIKRIASQERALAQGRSGLTAGALDTGRAGAI